MASLLPDDRGYKFTHLYWTDYSACRNVKKQIKSLDWKQKDANSSRLKRNGTDEIRTKIESK